jgi:hypothetical protein
MMTLRVIIRGRWYDSLSQIDAELAASAPTRPRGRIAADVAISQFLDAADGDCAPNPGRSAALSHISEVDVPGGRSNAGSGCTADLSRG